MGSRDYERLGIEPFGHHLITTGDLDPVYIALRGVDWSIAQRNRWLIAYWCFYHCGLASYASGREDSDFWNVLEVAAENSSPAPPGGRWPRGHERRHARGGQGINMVADLRWRYKESPDNMISYICGGVVEGFTADNKALSADDHVEVVPLSFRKVAARVQEHTLFGPWIAFKIADMIDRVMGIPVGFEQAHVFMFKDPVKAALMLWRQRMGLEESARPRDQAGVILEIVKYLIHEFEDLRAPPLNDRPIRLQEVETVLCKWKSHMNGHYPLFNDIDEINAGLEGWGDAALAFGAVMPSHHHGGSKQRADQV